MDVEAKKIESDNACNDCVAHYCKMKGSSGHVPNCPKDPAQEAYLTAFRLRNNGNKKQKT